MEFIFESQQTQDFAAPPGIVASVSVNPFGESQVPLRCQSWEKIEALKNKSDFSSTNICALGIGGRSKILTINDNPAACGSQQSSKQVQHRGFAAS
jgi:hypothetical protein